MLVLTRRVGDVVAIGDNIKVIVVSVNGKQVRLGIEADRSTTIHREEIYQKIKKEALAGTDAETENMQLAKQSVSESAPTSVQEQINYPEKKTVIIRKNNFKEVKKNNLDVKTTDVN